MDRINLDMIYQHAEFLILLEPISSNLLFVICTTLKYTIKMNAKAVSRMLRMLSLTELKYNKYLWVFNQIYPFRKKF